MQLFHDAAGEYPKLAELIASARERLITVPALICDIFWSFFKYAPEIRPVVPLTPAHQIHANFLEHLMATRLARAVHIGFVADLKALYRDLDDLRSKVKNVSPDASARCMEKFKAVRDRARTYATLLSLQQETIEEKIDALHSKATVMLMSGDDDEQPPEAPVSVPSVPRQEPARITAPALASLIDDYPTAPF